MEERLRFHSPLLRKRAAKQTLPSASCRTHSATATHCLLAVPPVQLFCLLYAKVTLVCFRIFQTRASLYRHTPLASTSERGLARSSQSPFPLPPPSSKRGEDSSSFLSLSLEAFVRCPFFSLALPFAAAGGGDNTCHGGEGERLRRSWTHLGEEDLLSSLAQGGARAASSLPPFYPTTRAWVALSEISARNN